MQQSQHRSQCWKHGLKSSTEMLSRAASGAVLGLLHPVAGGVLRKGLMFQTCANIEINFFTILEIFGSPTYTEKRIAPFLFIIEQALVLRPSCVPEMWV
jgi:hypothetical protein